MEVVYRQSAGFPVELSIGEKKFKMTQFRDTLDLPLGTGFYTFDKRTEVYSVSNIRIDSCPAGELHRFDLHSEKFPHAFIVPESETTEAYENFARRLTLLEDKDSRLRRVGVKKLKQILGLK